MWRPETKREKAARENPQVVVQQFAQNAHKFDMPSSAVMQEEMRKEREYKLDKARREEDADNAARLKQQTVQNELAAVKLGAVKSIPVSELYDNATTLYNQGERSEAAHTFWASFVCGEKRAVYDLYKMFYIGDGINKNIEIATIMFYVWSSLKNTRNSNFKDDRPYIHEGPLKEGCLDMSGTLYIAFNRINKDFAGGVTDEIINIQLASFKEIMSGRSFGLANDFIRHDIIYYTNHPEEEQVVLSGEDDDGGCGCVIL